MTYKAEIPFRLPSANEYINECRTNKFGAAKYKKDLEADIGIFLRKLPLIEKPVKIRFTWVEENRRRDCDNIAFGKKFVLDALVKAGKLKDDNRRCVTGFEDSFKYEKASKVIVEIMEV